MKNVLITPHIADNVHNWAGKYGEFFMENLALWLAGKTLKNLA